MMPLLYIEDRLQNLQRLLVITLLVGLLPAVAGLASLADRIYPNSRAHAAVTGKVIDVNLTIGLAKSQTNSTTEAEESR